MTSNPNALAPKPASPLEGFKSFIRREDVMQRFEDMLGSRQARPFVNDVIMAAAANPKLLECTQASLVTAALQSASLSLSVNPLVGQGHIVPYGKVAKFIPGWKGLRDMAYATNQVRYLHVGELYEGEYLDEDRITGRMELKGSKLSNKVHSLFCTLELYNGFRKTIARSLDEIHAHAKMYNPAGYNHAQGPWKSDKPKTVRGMEKKTIIREMITHWVPLDPYKKQLLTSIDETNYVDLNVIETEFKDDPMSQRAQESEAEDEEAILDGLGFSPDPRPSAPAPVPTESYPMSPDMAFGEKNEHGDVYATFTTEALVKEVQRQQDKLAKEKNPDERTKIQFRRDACSTIIMWRANHPEAYSE